MHGDMSKMEIEDLLEFEQLIKAKYSFNALLTTTVSCQFCCKVNPVTATMYRMYIELEKINYKEKNIFSFIICEECKNKILEWVRKLRKLYFEGMKPVEQLV
jgi:hypothetical protein